MCLVTWDKGSAKKKKNAESENAVLLHAAGRSATPVAAVLSRVYTVSLGGRRHPLAPNPAWKHPTREPLCVDSGPPQGLLPEGTHRSAGRSREGWGHPPPPTLCVPMGDP